MAGFVQVSDVVNFAKLAWAVYEYGWREDLHATKQFHEFGRDVRALAENLDILSRVLLQANHSLREQGAFNTPLRWDRSSLSEIIGDYEETLRECQLLIQDNKKYHIPGGPAKNIGWNALVEPQAERLRKRLLLHNSKVILMLKPFEIDLLCRVRQDIQRVHQDLIQRIQSVHLDVRRLIGVLIPDLEEALLQQENRQIHFLDIPSRIADGFRRAALADRPEYEDDDAFDLKEIADAFILHYQNSTVSFESGMLLENKIPPTTQYINLLKCIWLMSRMQNCSKLNQPASDSHWPSYVRQLENDLSSECERFGVREELVAPRLDIVSPHMFDIWPEKESLPLVDVVTQNELMEVVLQVPLQSGAGNVQRSLQLLRRMGGNNKRFRVNISGTEQLQTGKTRKHSETIDFDLNTALINPVFALPSSVGGLDLILRKDERIAKMAFQQLKDALKFQQAVTGFKPWAAYTQYNTVVSFVVSGVQDPIREEACIQIWIPKQMEGRLVTSSEAAEAPQKEGRTETLATGTTARSPTADSAVFSPLPMPLTQLDRLCISPEPLNGGLEDLGPSRAASGSLGILSSSPPTTVPLSYSQNPSSRLYGTANVSKSPPMAIPSQPDRSGPQYISGSSRQANQSLSPMAGTPPSSNAFPLAGLQQPQSSRMSRSPGRHSSISTANSRTFSLSSDVSVATQSNTSSSGSDNHTITVGLGGNVVGTIHRRPTKPMLVLFTQNRQAGKLSLVGIPLDEDTTINPSRCHCGRSGKDGAACPIASLERRNGKSDVEVRRFESRNGEADFNLARLAQGRLEEKGYEDALWKNVRRVSIMFPDARTRAKFAGTPNVCHCNVRYEVELNKCLQQGHKGLMGEVQEWYRREAIKAHKARHGSQHEVVNGPPGTYNP